MLHLAEGCRWVRLNSGGMQAAGVQKGRHSVGWYGISRESRDGAGRVAPGVRAA